jgi:glycogen debranching enzyme
METNILHKCYERAKEVIKKCSTPYGLFASGGNKGYTAVWSRDSMISMIGASLIENKEFQNVFKASLITLAENQGSTGQIPNCVDKFSEREPHVDFQTIDSTLWYIIGHYVYKSRYKDDSLIEEQKISIEKAMNWLSCQDPGEVGMLAQLPTSDWQDAFPHKYGHTINTQALYYKALLLTGKIHEAKKLKFRINEDESRGLWNENFYLAFRWKNHRKYKEIGEWFDSLGNMLAIVFDLANESQAEKILRYIQLKKINKPTPLKAIYPPIRKGDLHWQDYYKDCAAGKPFSYLNGGIWHYIGCFYVLALIKLGKLSEAEAELKKIAESNVRSNFPEWVHPLTGKASGNQQAWEAGAYILAYESLKKKKLLI